MEHQNSEKIGYHKGAVETLLKERVELMRLLSIVESLLRAHAEELKKHGIDITQQPQQQPQQR